MRPKIFLSLLTAVAALTVALQSSAVQTDVPIINEIQKLTPTTTVNAEYFGASVAISGNTAAVANENADEVYVYIQVGNTWQEQTKITAPPTVEWGFGRGLAIQDNILVIGAPGDNEQADGAGAAYVYTQTNGTWSLQQKLLASDGADCSDPEWPDSLYERCAGFGNAVAIDGDVIIIGARSDHEVGPYAGAAYIFRWDGNTWVEEQKLTATRYDRFGMSVAIKNNTAVVGADEDASAGVGGDSGAVHVFEYANGVWTAQAKLYAENPQEFTWFGTFLAFDGDHIVTTGNDRDGHPLHMFIRNGNTWERRVFPEFDATVVNAFNGRHLVIADFNYETELYNGNEIMVHSDTDISFLEWDGTTLAKIATLLPNECPAEECATIGMGINNDTAIIGIFDEYEPDKVNYDSAAYVFDIAALLFKFTSASPADGILGAPYTHTFAVEGDDPITYTVTNGTLPDGLSIIGNQITGTPTVGGAFPGEITASDGRNTDTQTFNIFVATPPTFTSPVPPDGILDRPYEHTFAVQGNVPMTIEVTEGQLPDGLTLTDGVISGTPTTAGLFMGEITATNAAGTDTQNFAIVIAASGGDPLRLYPYDEQHIQSDNYMGPNFTFKPTSGAEWYGVWIGTADYTQLLYKWYEASSICVAGTCTIDDDLWLANGNYIWWMSYWGPNQQDYNNYWNQTTFSVGFSNPSTTVTYTSPVNGTTGTAPTQITWQRDLNAQWYRLWIGTAGDYQQVYFEWVDATEACDELTCTLSVSELGLSFPDDEYEIWTQAWGPAGFLTWLQVNGGQPSTFTVGSAAATPRMER